MTQSRRSLHRSHRRVGALLLPVATVAALALSGCGSASSTSQHLSVGTSPATRAPVAPASSRSASRPSASGTSASGTSASGTSASGTSASGTSASGTSASGTCAVTDLRADQVPVSSGTSRFFLAWSLTNIATSTCTLPAGQPTLAFRNASGSAITTYRVAHLSTTAATSITLTPGHAAWFLTEETTTTACGTGTTVGDGPFHYVIALPGGAGSVSWSATYLSGSTLSDFCGSVSLEVGDLQSSEPTVS